MKKSLLSIGAVLAISVLPASGALAVEAFTCEMSAVIMPGPHTELFTINVNGSPVDKDVYTCSATKGSNGFDPINIECKIKDAPESYITTGVYFTKDTVSQIFWAQSGSATSPGKANKVNSISGLCSKAQDVQKDMHQNPFSGTR